MTTRLPLTRRRLLQVTAGGVVAALGRPALAQGYDGPITWISPRGTLEVMDDYAYWTARRMGYFGDLQTEMQPGPSDGTATVKFVDVGQADMGFPSPGVFAFGLREGMNLRSVFHMAPLDVFSFAFRQGEGVQDLKELEGKTVLLGSAAWQSIVEPLLESQGVDPSTVTYVEAGWPAWGTALAAGQGDAALAWEGLRAEWIASGLDFQYWLGVQRSSLPANTFVVRAADLEDDAKREALTRYLRGWAMGLEFAHANPRAAAQAVFDEFPTVASNLGPELATTSLLQLANAYRCDWDARQGWGWHDLASWQQMFDLIARVDGSTPQVAEQVCTNELVPDINNFDAAQVAADAEAAGAPAAFASVDVDAIRANLFARSV